MIELQPVELTDAETIFEAWGRYPENFAYLTARVFADLDDARRYLAKLFSTPESREGVLKNWVVYPAQGGRAFDNYSYVKIPGETGR